MRVLGHSFRLLQFLSLCIGLIACGHSQNNEVDENNASRPAEERPLEENEPHDSEETTIVTSATVAAVGDVLLHSSVYLDAQTGDTFHFDDMFTAVKPYVMKADIAIANQESMIGGQEIGLSSYPQFNSPFEIGDTLKRSGFNIVSLANNHTLDRGEQAVMNALNHWDSLQMPYVGAYKSSEDRAKLRIIEKNDIRFSFLAYTYGTNGIPVPTDKPYLVNLIDKEQIKSDIAQAREQADVIVVSLHFGTEYERLPNEEQIELVQFVADEGAHLIVGHHPHVLQPVDYVQSKKGHDAFVIYSLGNFLAAQEAKHDHYRRTGGILFVDIEKRDTDEETTISVIAPSFLPTYIHFENWKNFKILPMHKMTDEDLPNIEQIYEETKEHVSQYLPELHFITNE